jgi:predicted DNA-binding transcriptional regulator AlpA
VSQEFGWGVTKMDKRFDVPQVFTTRDLMARYGFSRTWILKEARRGRFMAPSYVTAGQGSPQWLTSEVVAYERENPRWGKRAENNTRG